MVTGASHGKFHSRWIQAPWRRPKVQAAATARVTAVAMRVRRSASPATSAGATSQRSQAGVKSPARRHWRERNSPKPPTDVSVRLAT